MLAAAVVGSGVMAERLAGGNVAIALLANTGATVAVLATLIALLGPVSGAHFNPAVSLVQAVRKALPWREAGGYVVVQVLVAAWVSCSRMRCSGCPGCSPRFMSEPARANGLPKASRPLGCSWSSWVTAGEDAPWMVAAWIGAAYWFTASTSFANPAITIARSLSDTFAGIRPWMCPHSSWRSWSVQALHFSSRKRCSKRPTW